MSDERLEALHIPTVDKQPRALTPLQLDFPSARGVSCEIDPAMHCITCSDEAQPVTVLSVDEEAGLALVSVQDTTEEIDITLVDNVTPGVTLLAHGGVAIAKLDEASNE